MQQDITAVQYLGMIMKNSKFQLEYVFSLVEILNHSYLSCKDVVIVLEDIFKNEKSGKIIVATQVLEYLIKNCNRNFHQAANKQSFQKSILGLLKRQRGKMSLLKEMRSNAQNWSRIQSKILYLIQLWYDAFILEEGKYKNIIENYKVLRKQSIVFPPRNVNEKSLLTVQTQSPIFENIETIAQNDKQKFKKKLKALGLNNLSEKFDKLEQRQQRQNKPINARKDSEVNIDEVSEKIAIIRSQQFEGKDVLRIIQDIKKDIQYGKVKVNQQPYWKQIKEAAEILIVQWEEKNAQLIQQEEMKYLQQKLGGLDKKKSSEQEQKIEGKIEKQNQPRTSQEVDLLDLEIVQNKQPQEEKQVQKIQTNEVNLLDL